MRDLQPRRDRAARARVGPALGHKASGRSLHRESEAAGGERVTPGIIGGGSGEGATGFNGATDAACWSTWPP